MLDSVKQVAIKKYEEELDNFINNFVKLSKEQKLFKFAEAISRYNINFIDYGKIIYDNCIRNYRFFLKGTIIKQHDKSEEFYYFETREDDIEKLIHLTFEKIVDKYKNNLNDELFNNKFTYSLDLLIKSIESDRLI